MDDKELQTEILQRIDSLAEALGTTAEYLWSSLVSDVIVRGWTQALVCLLAIVVAYVAQHITLARLIRSKWFGADEELVVLTASVVWTLFAVFSLMMFGFIVDGALEIAAPHLEAMKILRGGE